MLTLSQWENIATVVFLVLAGTLLVRFVATGLHRRYRWFSLLLAVALVQQIVALRLPPASDAYGWFYVFSQPVLWLFYYLAVLELARLLLKDYPGIAGFGKLLIKYGLPLTLTVAIALTVFASQGAGTKFPLLNVYFAIEHVAVFSIALFLLLLDAIVLYFPLELNRNVVLFCFGYPFYLGCQVVFYDLLSLLKINATDEAYLVVIAIELLTLLVWLIGLSPAGENRVVRTTVWSPGEGERLRNQLEGINAAMLRLLKPDQKPEIRPD